MPTESPACTPGCRPDAPHPVFQVNPTDAPGPLSDLDDSAAFGGGASRRRPAAWRWPGEVRSPAWSGSADGLPMAIPTAATASVGRSSDGAAMPATSSPRGVIDNGGTQDLAALGRPSRRWTTSTCGRATPSGWSSRRERAIWLRHHGGRAGNLRNDHRWPTSGAWPATSLPIRSIDGMAIRIPTPWAMPASGNFSTWPAHFGYRGRVRARFAAGPLVRGDRRPGTAGRQASSWPRPWPPRSSDRCLAVAAAPADGRRPSWLRRIDGRQRPFPAGRRAGSTSTSDGRGSAAGRRAARPNRHAGETTRRTDPRRPTAAQDGGVPQTIYEGFHDARIQVRGSYRPLGRNACRGVFRASWPATISRRLPKEAAGCNWPAGWPVPTIR